MSAEALRHKELGNQAMARNMINEAVSEYSEAIRLDPKNHVLYSNRAIAYLKLANFPKALDDANSCIRINGVFVKAYVTKGAALHQLDRFDEARQAYEAGLAVDPSNQSLRDNLNMLNANRGGAAAGAGAGAPGAGAGASGARVSAKQFFLGNEAAKQASIHNAVRAFILINLVGYILPIFPGTFSADCYSRAVFALVAFLAIQVFNTHGRPRLSQEYAARVFQDNNTQHLFVALILLTGPTKILAVLPLIAVQMLYLFEYVYQVSLAFFPGFSGSLAGTGTQLGARISGDASFPTLSYQDKWRQTTVAVMRLAAMGEVLVGISLIIELLTPMRSLLLTLMYWQLLQLRYVTNADVKGAFGQVDRTFLQLTSHNLCPGIIRTVYMKVRDFLHARVQPPTNPQAAPPRCTIM